MQNLSQTKEKHTKLHVSKQQILRGFRGVLAYNFIILSLIEFIFCAVLVLLNLQYLLEHAQFPVGDRFAIAPVILEILKSMWKSMVLYTPWPSTQRVMNNGDNQILIPYDILKISIKKLLIISTCCWKECWIINATRKLQNLA